MNTLPHWVVGYTFITMVVGVLVAITMLAVGPTHFHAEIIEGLLIGWAYIAGRYRFRLAFSVENKAP